MTQGFLINELDRLSAEIEKMRLAVADALCQEEFYSTQTVGGIVPLSLLEKRAILSAVNATHGNMIEAAHRRGSLHCSRCGRDVGEYRRHGFEETETRW